MSLSEASKVFQRLPHGISPEDLTRSVSRIKRVTILKTFWYPEIIDPMEASAKAYLSDLKLDPGKVEVIGVPGSFELPLAAKIASKYSDIVIALGCVIQGDTPHFDFVCRETLAGLSRVSLDEELPLGMGVLTVTDKAQAEARVNKGMEAAQAAVMMWTLKGTF